MDAHGPLSDNGVVRLLTHTGDRLEHPEYSPFAQDLDFAALRAMWREMVIVRAFDTEATSLQRQGELGLWVAALGQEAAQIGSGHALTDRDWVFPSYREHGVAYLRGVDLADILRTFRGLEHSSWVPNEHNFHLYTLVIGAHTLHATGYAMAMDWDGLVGSGRPDHDAAVICYFGDGATSEGDTNEALVFAAVNNAPIVFFCQNNQYAISEPTTRQSKVALAQRASGVGIPGVRVDGNDVLASYAVTRQALERARSGGGPTFIEALTYRMAAHTTSDDPTRYRTRDEEDYWRERDPIARLTAYLERAGELPQAFQEEVRAEGKELATRARIRLKESVRAPARDMFDHVYAEPHATVDSERAWYERYEESFVDAEGSHR
ncbi:MAG: pyruvate dehydrogenase (acetyl-transferring) E1 component subunit alpha [Demequinaceae bacterium]|nr:pyruvate dehydrogenase (acetyl-transferring) E1 component subunit alpha [Demequinaceae bacterium]